MWDEDREVSVHVINESEHKNVTENTDKDEKIYLSVIKKLS